MPRRPRVFRDPVHGNVEFSRTLPWDVLGLALIDTAEVQRLRRVAQLGLANLVYHGVEHSRFTHTLGVTHLAKRLYRASCDHSGRPQDDRELAIVVAAALLHDIGHPPFSHAVEKELGVRHEKATVAILRGSTLINEELRRFGGDAFVDAVASHIEGASDAPTVDIISSQLDADRLDYLLRDGFHAGVPNSQYDLERIIQMAGIDDDGLYFDQRGQFAIEGYFLARYHLYLQLYYHKTVRAAEVMLRAVIRRAKGLANCGASLGQISPALERLCRTSTIEDATAVSDADMWAAFGVWCGHEDAILRDLSQRLLYRNLFRIIEIPKDSVPKFYEKWLPQIRDIAGTNRFDPDFYVLPDTASDTPYKVADYGTSTSIRIVDDAGRAHLLEALSGITGALQEAAYQKVRCCFPLELRPDVQRVMS